jgi:adenine-specific DNA-methyltransferase
VVALERFIKSPGPGDGFFVDAFCGTGVVAETAARLGWRVRINDHLKCATTLSAARLTSRRQVTFSDLGGYLAAIEFLNALPSRSAFIAAQYSPLSAEFLGIERRYFTIENAGKIDAIREQIRRWSDARLINKAEERLLIADLLLATNRVANIAGTYGCYLRHWLQQSMAPLRLVARKLSARNLACQIQVGDASSVTAAPEDLVYLDPPYTKRQYAAYYHILETICEGDQPAVEGKTGLRPWRDKASDFCYRNRALGAISSLVEHLSARRVLLSYSSEGHVSLEALKAALAKMGQVQIHMLRDVGRYRPNHGASIGGAAVREYLIRIERTARVTRRVASA